MNIVSHRLLRNVISKIRYFLGEIWHIYRKIVILVGYESKYLHE